MGSFPLASSAPSVLPWYELLRAMIVVRTSSPRARWYARAILMAVSTASLPPDTG